MAIRTGQPEAQRRPGKSQTDSTQEGGGPLPNSRQDPLGPLGLARAYYHAVARPAATTYGFELQYASALRLLVGLAAAGIFLGIRDLKPYAYGDPVTGWFGQLEARQTGVFKGLLVESPWLAVILDVLLVFATFFLGACWLRLWAWNFRKGAHRATSLTSYFYALSISYVPLHIASGLLLFVWPRSLGQEAALLVSLGLFLYHLYCASVAIQATHVALLWKPESAAAGTAEDNSTLAPLGPAEARFAVVRSVLFGLLSIVVLFVASMVIFFVFFFRIP